MSSSPPRTSLPNQTILARKGSGIHSAADLSGKRVCAVSGTTSLSRVFALDPRPNLVGVTSWTDCLLMMQQGQVDAISTDDVVLFGLAEQDPNVRGRRPQPGHRALRHRDQEGQRRSRSVRQRCPRSRSAPTEPGSASTTPGCTASGPHPARRRRGIRTDDDTPESRRTQSTKLVELESHPGLEHLRRYLTVGRDRSAVGLIEPALSQMWDDLAELEGLSAADDIADGIGAAQCRIPSGEGVPRRRRRNQRD